MEDLYRGGGKKQKSHWKRLEVPRRSMRLPRKTAYILPRSVNGKRTCWIMPAAYLKVIEGPSGPMQERSGSAVRQNWAAKYGDGLAKKSSELSL